MSELILATLPLDIDELEEWVEALPKKTYLGRMYNIEDNPLVHYITSTLPTYAAQPQYNLKVGTDTGMVSFNDENGTNLWAGFKIAPELGEVLRRCCSLNPFRRKIYRERVLKAINKIKEGDPLESLLYVARES